MSHCSTRYRWFVLMIAVALLGGQTSFAQLSGTKTIGGATPDYATIKAALRDLTAQGVTSPGVTFLLRSGTYDEDSLRISTSTATEGSPIVIKPDVGATVVVNVTPPNATINYAISIDTTSYVTIDGAAEGGSGTSRDLTVNSLGATNGSKGIRVYGRSVNCVVKNVIVSCAGSLTSSTTRGVDVLYSGPSQPINTFVDNVYVKRAGVGVRFEGNISTDRMQKGTVQNCVLGTGAADTIGINGVFSYYTDSVTVRNNIIRNIYNNGTPAGIAISSYSVLAQVYNNDISGVYTSSTSGIPSGISYGGTQNPGGGARIFNNFISNVDGPAAGTGAIYGIYITSTNPTVSDSVYYNSVNLTGSGTGTKTTAAFAFTATTTGYSVVLRNNILKNTRSDGTSASSVAVAIRKGGTGTILQSSNNDLYVGTPDTTHATGLISTTRYATLADWQTGSGQDAGSLTENPPYLSAADLHLNTSTPTQLESAGTPVSVDTDIDGNARNGTTPDIGADEGTFIGADLTPPTIAHTALENTASTGNRVASADITDLSGVGTGTGAPRLWYKNSTDVSYTGVTADSLLGSTYYFTLPGRPAGTTVQYYLGAQDASSGNNVGTLPAGGSGINPPGSTPPGTVFSYVVQSALPGGTYTVGTGGDFPTLDSAFNKLAIDGVSGAVTLELTDANYRPAAGAGRQSPLAAGDPMSFMREDEATGRIITENVSLPRDNPDVTTVTVIGPIPGASAANRVTVRPATGVNTSIIGTGAATFQFLNVSYVTFDGVSTSGATQMSIENSASGGVAIALLGNSDHNTIRNVTLKAPYANGISVFLDTASLAAPDSNDIINNLMPITSRAIYLRGGNYIAYGNRITGNVMGADSIGALAIYNQQVNGTVIAGNTIRNVVDATAAGGNTAGIWVATKQLNMSIYDNVIAGVRNRASATAAVFAAGVYYFGTAGDTSRSRIYNNMVYNIDNLSSSTAADARGMYISTGILDTVAYNSVSISGTDVAAATSAAIRIGAAVLLTLRNNIETNSRTTTGAGRAIAHYAQTTTSTYTSDYNDLHAAGGTGSYVAAVATTNYATLADWQTTGRDLSSISERPKFVAPDLHINPDSATGIEMGGTPIASIRNDIDGDRRGATNPDIGADEFVLAPQGATIYTSAPHKAIPDNNTTGIKDTIFIPASEIGLAQVVLDTVYHTYVGDLIMYLVSPRGDSVVIMNRPGSPSTSSGDNFFETVFSDSAARSIQSITPLDTPHTAYWRPGGPGTLSLYTGTMPAGNWVLSVSDRAGQDVGRLDRWSIRIYAPPANPMHDIGATTLSAANAPEARFQEDEIIRDGHGGSRAMTDADRKARQLERERRLGPAAWATDGRSATIVSAQRGAAPNGDAYDLKAVVANFGGFTENSYQVAWSIDGTVQTAVANTDSLTVGDLDTLTLTWASPTPGQHTARAWTVLASDTNRTNDTSNVFSFEVIGPNVLLQEGFNADPFPPTGWLNINRDGGTGGAWYRSLSSPDPIEGPSYAGDNYASSNGFYIDDYLVTPNVAGPTPSGSIDSLTFWMTSRTNAPDPDYPDSLMIMFSSTGSDTSNFTMVEYFNVPKGVWTRKAYALPTGANRYVAFRYLIYNGGPSGTNSDKIGIDDVRVTRYVGTTPEPVTEQIKDHRTSTILTSVTNEGNIGSLNAFVGTGPGSGFQFNPIGTQHLFEGSLIIATDSNHVSDAARNNATPEAFDADFKFLQNIDSVGQGVVLTRHTAYTDSLAEAPLRIRVNQTTVTVDTAGQSSILHVQLDVTNMSAGTLSGVTVGAYFDWDVNASTALDRGSVVKDSVNTIPGVNGGNPFLMELLELHQGTSPNAWVGIVPLSTNRFKGRRIAIQSTEVYPPHMSNGDKWLYINTNRATNPDGDAGSAVDQGQVFGLPSFNLVANQTQRVGFAIVAGTSLGDFVASARAAQRNWVLRLGNTMDIPTSIENNPLAGVPETYQLDQNYPNPFNPSTVIRYGIPKESHVTMKIYNILGQEIATLVDEVKAAGYFETVWNGQNSFGSQISTGVYFYRIEARANDGETFTSFKKMLLMK